MKLYIGGKYQGQDRLAENENPDSEIIYDFHELLRDVEDALVFARQFCTEHPNSIVVSDEVGCGVIPVERSERLWREKVGRALCVIAQSSESVTRVVCGIGVKIK